MSQGVKTMHTKAKIDKKQQLLYDDNQPRQENQ